MEGTEGARLPFWSPEGRSVGFCFADNALKIVNASAGAPRTLTTASDPAGGTWNDVGVILYASDPGGLLYRIDPAGGGGDARDDATR